jgi:hypothetical protein
VFNLGYTYRQGYAKTLQLKLYSNNSGGYEVEAKLHLQVRKQKRLNASVQNLLSSQLLSKNLKIRIYKTIILPVVLYGCETWSLTLREEQTGSV